MTRFPTAGAPGLLGAVRPRGQGVRRARRRAAAPPGTATATWPSVLGEAAVGCRPGPTPSSANATGASPAAAARRRPSSRSAAPSWSSSGTCSSDPDAHFHDLGPDFYDNRIDPEPQEAQPHPPTRSPRLQGHPRTRRLTQRDHLMTRLRCAPPGSFACRPRHHFRIRGRGRVLAPDTHAAVAESLDLASARRGHLSGATRLSLDPQNSRDG